MLMEIQPDLSVCIALNPATNVVSLENYKNWINYTVCLDQLLERAAGLLEEEENQDDCSDLRAH